MSRRIVVLPDVHVPNHNEQSIKPIFQFIKYYKPDTLIQLGDFCDWDSVSSYDVAKESEVTNIDKEINESNFLLDDIDRVCGKKCHKIMLGGNHEARYEKFIANNGCILSIRRMKSFTSWKNEYNLMGRHWDAKDYGEHIQIGKVIFTHGWYTSNNACQQMARCFPGRNVIFGHTHRHDISGCMDERDLPIESETIGTLSKFSLAYLKGKPPVNWVNGFMYIDMNENGTFSKHFVHVIEGKFIEHGKEFN